MHPPLTNVAEKYVAALAASEPQPRFVSLKITRKGNAPAQYLKKIALTRLAASIKFESVEHFKGDTYTCKIAGQVTNFRFAVTAARDKLPWFNLSFRELESLAASTTVLLVIWNSSREDEWCNELHAFCLPPDAIHERLKESKAAILLSALQATLRKLQRDQTLSPEHRNSILEKLPRIPEKVDNVDRIASLEKLKKRFEDVFANELDDLSALKDEERIAAHHLLAKLKERLRTLLLHIHPTSSGGFIVQHDKTESVLMDVTPSLWTKLYLGDIESALLRSAYAGGIEIDETTDFIETIAHPYDPTKTKVDTRPITVDLLVRRISHGEIDLNPAFQRKAGLWTPQQKSQLIESLLIRIPLPSFYFDATDDSRWLVVDGLQRLVAFKDFIAGSMPLVGLEYLVQYNGKRFEDLPRPLRRAIDESQVTIHLIQPGTPPEVKFNIFRRVNTGGLVLTAQEIRHALNQGPVVQLLTDMASMPEFLSATGGSISANRMADREFVLRFLAFTVTPYSEYRTPDMDSFLSAQMGRLNKLEMHYRSYEERFRNAMNTAISIFGKHAFRKQYFKTQSRSLINKALFETWSVHLGSLDGSDTDIVLQNAEKLLSLALDLNRDPEFEKAISQGTADVARVRRRFSAVGAVINAVLKGESDAD